MQKLGTLWITIPALLMIMACGKDSIEEDSWTVPDEPRIIVESAQMVTGITDENGIPLDGLTAAFNDTIRLVDKGDYFQFKGNQLNKRGEVLRLTDKEGRQFYFTQRPVENEVAYFQQVIIRNKPHFVHKSHNTLDLSLDNNSRIRLEPNQYKKSVQSYSGDVVIEYFSFNTQLENHRAALPGGITGMDKFNSRGLLKMTSAFSLTFKTPNAENLEISGALLTSSHLNDKNVLFYYNEKSHNWEEVIGSDGNSGTVAINKSGYYCMAEIVPYVSLRGRLMVGSSPAPNQKVTVSYDGIDQTVFTSNGGIWEALVPADAALQYRYHLPCYQDPKIINTPTKDLILPIDFPTQDIQTTRFSGRLLNCSGQPLTSGFIQVQGSLFNAVLYMDNPIIDLAVPHCSSGEISIRAYDAESGETGPWIDWLPNYDNRVYNIFACQQMVNPYLEVHSAEGGVIYRQLKQTKTQNKLQLEATDQNNPGSFFSIVFPIEEKGIQPNDQISLNWKDVTFAGKGISVNCTFSYSCGFENFELTHLSAEQNGWVRGHFKARLWSKILGTLQVGYVEVEGSFQCKRNF